MNQSNQKVSVVIPARLESTRLPKKALLDLGGLPMVVRVYKQVEKCKLVDQIVIATDSAAIKEAALAHGAEVVMTSVDCKNGSERVAEAARSLASGWVMNVQGDEPFVEPELIDSLIEFSLAESNQCSMTSACFELASDDPALNEPSMVKVVLNQKSEAIYFSRSQIPNPRQNIPGQKWYGHMGLYLFKSDFLQTFVNLPVTLLEQTESLEQLRALFNRQAIGMYIWDGPPSIGIDTPEDYQRAKARF